MISLTIFDPQIVLDGVKCNGEMTSTPSIANVRMQVGIKHKSRPLTYFAVSAATREVTGQLGRYKAPSPFASTIQLPLLLRLLGLRQERSDT
jgi:hypothetical protein